MSGSANLIIPGVVIGGIIGYVLTMDNPVAALQEYGQSRALVSQGAPTVVQPERNYPRALDSQAAPTVVQPERNYARALDSQAEPTVVQPERSYYPGCDAVRAAGRAPLYRGQPGYREGMDGDLDGIACEPIRDVQGW